MINSRLIARIWLVFFASLNRYFFRYLANYPTNNSDKVLIPTQLLLGDCILMLSLIEKVIKNHPNSEIVVAAPFYQLLGSFGLRKIWLAYALFDL